MNQTKAIKALALLHLALLPINLLISLTLDQQLPPLLLEHLDEQTNSNSIFLDLAFLAVALPALVAEVIASIGVLMEKVWSRHTLLIANALMLLTIPFAGPYFEHGIPTALESFNSIILGALLALLYFGDSPVNQGSKQT